jgi:hypothetical protein
MMRTLVVGRARFTRLSLLVFSLVPMINAALAQQEIRSGGSEPVPEPAVAAILGAFDEYQVVRCPNHTG